MRFVPLHLVKPLKAGKALAAKLEPRSKDCVAWVTVQPYKKGEGRFTDKELEHVPWEYSVCYFEVLEKYIAEEADIPPSSAEHYEQQFVQTLDEVDTLLERLLGDPSQLHLMSDYPDYMPF